MAKKGNRFEFSMLCTTCKRTNYRTSKNKINSGSERKLLNKYCPQCKKATEHKEVK
jgi:large subunit ribosomal protein L33